MTAPNTNPRFFADSTDVEKLTFSTNHFYFRLFLIPGVTPWFLDCHRYFWDFLVFHFLVSFHYFSVSDTVQWIKLTSMPGFEHTKYSISYRTIEDIVKYETNAALHFTIYIRQYIDTVCWHKQYKLPLCFPRNLYIKTLMTELTVCCCGVNCWNQWPLKPVSCYHWKKAL